MIRNQKRPSSSTVPDMDSDLRALSTVSVSTIASLSCCYFLVPRLPRGKPRLVSLLPIIILFTALPLFFSSVHLRGISGFFLAWLGVFKLILYAFQQGPLSDPTLPLPTFIALASLPVKIRLPDKANQPKKPNPRQTIPSHVAFALKLAALSWVVSFYPHRHLYPRIAVLLAYGVHMYLALDMVLYSSAVLSRVLLRWDVELEPQFSAPYLSTSLQDFWGRRWNLMVTRILHPAVYKPVRSMWGPLAGVVAAFLVSGLMHELMFYYLTRRKPTAEMTWFFLLHGVSTALEVKAKRVLGRKGWPAVPRVLATLMTVVFVAVTGLLLFLPPLLRGGETEEKVVEECLAMFEMGRVTVVGVLGGIAALF